MGLFVTPSIPGTAGVSAAVAALVHNVEPSDYSRCAPIAGGTPAVPQDQASLDALKLYARAARIKPGQRNR